jgi:hypothetical protein
MSRDPLLEESVVPFYPPGTYTYLLHKDGKYRWVLIRAAEPEEKPTECGMCTGPMCERCIDGYAKRVAQLVKEVCCK